MLLGQIRPVAMLLGQIEPVTMLLGQKRTLLKSIDSCIEGYLAWKGLGALQLNKKLTYRSEKTKIPVWRYHGPAPVDTSRAAALRRIANAKVARIRTES